MHSDLIKTVNDYRAIKDKLIKMTRYAIGLVNQVYVVERWML